jgi:hypothetical protein
LRGCYNANTNANGYASYTDTYRNGNDIASAYIYTYGNIHAYANSYSHADAHSNTDPTTVHRQHLDSHQHYQPARRPNWAHSSLDRE